MADEALSLAWKQLAAAWRKTTAPARPTAGNVETYRKALRLVIPPSGVAHVLVLGSTPELRDIIAGFPADIELVSCDINHEMFMAMASLLEKKLPDEIFVRADWTNVPLTHHYFDIIMGDGVLGNVGNQKLETFLKHMRQLLKSDGLFVTRVPHYPTTIKVKNIPELLDLFSQHPDNATAESSLFLCLQILTADTQNKKTSMARCREALNPYFDSTTGKYQHPSEFVTKLLNGDFLFNSLQSDKEWDYDTEAGYIEKLERYFSIEEKIHDPNEHTTLYYKALGSFLPIFILKPKAKAL